MTDSTPMDILLGERDAPPEPAKVDDQPTTQADEPVEEQAEAKAEADASKQETGEKVDAPPASDQDGEGEDEFTPEAAKGQYAALKETRRKLQEAQEELERLRSNRQEKPEEDKPRTSFFDDEDRAFTERAQELEQRNVSRWLDQSQFIAERDFGADTVKDSMAKFKQMAQDNPRLVQEFSSHPSPYHYLVETVQKAQEFEAMKDIDSYKERLRAEVEAELKAELEAKQAERSGKRASIPKSLAGAPSRGGLKGSDWAGPTPAEKLYGN